MIKKYLIALSLFSFFSLSVLSQDKFGPITLSYGQEIEDNKQKIVQISGEINGKIYTLANKGKKYYVKVFDSAEMKLISTNLIEFPELKNKDLDFESLKVIGNKIYVFGSMYDRKNKEFDLAAIEINADGTLNDAQKVIFKTPVTKKKERGAFYFKKSPVENKLLVMHATLFDKEEAIQYEIKLFDEDLNEITSHLEKVPFEDRRDLEFSISDFDISFKDDIFLIINESYRDRKQKKNIEKFEIHAFKKDKNYEKEVIKLDFENKEVINCAMLATQDGLLQFVGFYSSVNKRGKANWKLKGIYSGTVDINSNEVLNLKFNEFDYETKVKLIGERRAKKGKDVKPYYQTHSLIEKPNGGLILLSEYQLVYVGRTGGIGPLGITPIQFTKNEIIVTSLNPDGTVEWSNVIAKKQRAAYSTLSIGFFGFAGSSNFSVGVGIAIPVSQLGKGPEYLGAIPIFENGKLTVVFNDHKKNTGVTDIEEIRSLGNYNKSIPTAFTFDDNGKITRLDPQELQEERLILRPGVYYRKSPKEYIIYSSRRSKDKLGRLIID
ncbi:hypothetical protein [Tenacibaculum jejuense]|nr:hypothetical protein [Tenacibaculum jejuense]